MYKHIVLLVSLSVCINLSAEGVIETPSLGVSLNNEGMQLAQENMKSPASIVTGVCDNLGEYAKDPLYATLAVGISIVLAVAVLEGLNYWVDNNRVMNAHTIDKILTLINDLHNDQYSFEQRDRAYYELKKYTRYFGEDFKLLYTFLTSPKGILARYQQYKKLFFIKKDFDTMVQHAKTELAALMHNKYVLNKYPEARNERHNDFWIKL